MHLELTIESVKIKLNNFHKITILVKSTNPFLQCGGLGSSCTL
jgi:hypothetical protein